MNQKLFVYGTLMFPEIQEALLQKRVKSKDAILEGFSANSLVFGQYITEYPFLKPDNRSKVQGKILYDLTGHDLNLIKFYEGSEYTLLEVNVITGNKNIDVNTFMLNTRVRIEYGPEWEQNKFVSEHLDAYVSDLIPQLLMNYNM
jgi:gamma-glutamylcyclotransferase (GGCT)/AIG2-like uncharacterized protein YtfP